MSRFVSFLLLMPTLALVVGCANNTSGTGQAIAPPKPVVIIDTGFQLSAGHFETTDPLPAGDYEFEVTSTDGVTIMTYVSSKDLQIVRANGDGAEYYQDCSATKNIRFHQTCTLRNGAVFTIKNPNLFQSINVNLKVTRVR